MNLVALTTNDLLTRLVKNLDLRAINAGNLIVSLHQGFPGSTGESEVSGTHYVRQALTFNPASTGEIVNQNQLQFFKRTDQTIITETLLYSDNFNRANVGYCAGSIGPFWRVHTGCAGIDSNRLKMGLNVSQAVRATWDNGVSALAGQFARARLRSYRYRPQVGLVLMAPGTGDTQLGGYRALVHPNYPGVADGPVRLYRRSDLLTTSAVPQNPPGEWTMYALPFIDHTFIQVKREADVVIEYDDYSADRLTTGYQGLDVSHSLVGSQDDGWDVFWDDWEAGGAALSVNGGGGSPDVLITHIGFWTADQTLFLGSAKFNSSIHMLLNQILTIAIGDLKLSISNGTATATDTYRDKQLDRFGRGINFTAAPLKMSLHTASPGTTGANEIDVPRTIVPTDTWAIADDQVTTNAIKIDFQNIPTNLVTHLGVWSIDDEFLFGVELSAPISATLPIQTVRFLAGRLKFVVPSSAIGFLTANGTSTVEFSGVGIAVGVSSMDGIGAAAFDSSAVNVGALSSDGVASAAFVGKEIFPGWGSWTNRSATATGFNQFNAIADGTDRIYFSRLSASDSQNVFQSLLKSNLTSYTTHTMPTSGQRQISSIAPMDDGDTVYLGTGTGGGSAALYRFTHSGGFTNLSWPGPSVDQLFVQRHPFNTNILFVGMLAGTGDDVQLYTYNISGASWTKIGGTGLNGSWNVSSSSRAVLCGKIHHPAVSDGTYIYAIENGGTTNNLNVWRATIDNYTDWVKIGGASTNSSWATGTKRNGHLHYSTVTGKLYAFIGGGTAGDAEVWACSNPGTSPAWTQIGGDSINGSWAPGNWVNCSRVTHRGHKIVTALSGSANGDGDVWEYDEVTAAWTQIGGDSIGSSWSAASTLTQVNGLHTDREDRLWASPSNNSTGTPQLWSEAVA